MPARLPVPVLAVVSVLAVLPATVRAEDQRGRWSFGFGFSLQSTLDDVRNNAALLVTRESDINRVPDGDLSNDRIVVFDPRADDLLGRETKVEEKQRFDFSAAYGLNSWLSLQFDVGYYEGDVSPVDVQLSVDRWSPPQPTSDVNPSQLNVETEISAQPITGGRLTQIPVSLNAVVRFRKDSPFNPFMGLGVGYMFHDLEVSDSLDDLNRRILRGFQRVMEEPGTDTLINIQEVTAGFVNRVNKNSQEGVEPDNLFNVDCTNIGDPKLQANILNTCTSSDPDPRRQAGLATQPFLKAEVEDSFFWQFSVGADYHFNDRVSAFVVARYQVTDAKVNFSCTGPRSAVDASGSVGNLVTSGTFDVDQCSFVFIGEENPREPTGEDNRFLRTDPSSGNLTTARKSTLNEQILFQGGEIDLTAFTVGAGVRFTF